MSGNVYVILALTFHIPFNLNQKLEYVVCVFQESKEILIGLAAFRRIARNCGGACQSQRRQRKERRSIKLPSAIKCCHHTTFTAADRRAALNPESAGRSE